MQEMTENQLLHMLNTGEGKHAVFFYTPLCGTCKLAERMLAIVEMTALSFTLYKININFAPKLREAWKLSSVPCLVLLEDGEPLRVEYAMRSVDYLYEMLNI